MPRPIAVAVGDLFPYVLPDNREDPVEDRVTWWFRPPTVEEDREYQNEVRQVHDVGTRALKILRRHLRNVDNFRGPETYDPESPEVEYRFQAKRDGSPTNEFLERIQPITRILLANAILDRGTDSSLDPKG